MGFTLNTPPSARSGWQTATGNASWLIGERILKLILGFAVAIWVARHLGPADFGLITSTLAWVALFGCAAGLGIEPIIVRELVRRPAETGAIMSTALALRAIGGTAAGAIAIIASVGLPSIAPNAGLSAIASLATLLALSDALDLWFQATLRARSAASMRLVVFAFSCGTRVVLIVFNVPPVWFLWQAGAEAALTTALFSVLFFRSNRRFSFRPSALLAHSFLAESWPNVVSSLAAMGYLKADRVMLAAMEGESAAGLYSAAVTPVEGWYFLPTAIMSSAMPYLTRLHCDDEESFMSELGRIARLQAGLGWAVAIPLAISAPWLMPLLYGPAYAAGAPVLAVLAFALPFAFLGLSVSPWYQNTGLTRLAMRRHLLGGALNLALNFAFSPRFGPAGAALGTLIAYAVAHVLANGLSSISRPLLHLQLRALFLLPYRPPCKSPHS